MIGQNSVDVKTGDLIIIKSTPEPGIPLLNVPVIFLSNDGRWNIHVIHNNRVQYFGLIKSDDVEVLSAYDSASL